VTVSCRQIHYCTCHRLDCHRQSLGDEPKCFLIPAYPGKKGTGSPYSISKRRVPELIPILGSSWQVTWVINSTVGCHYFPAGLKWAATNFAAWWTEARWVWTVYPRLLPDSVMAAHMDPSSSCCPCCCCVQRKVWHQRFDVLTLSTAAQWTVSQDYRTMNSAVCLQTRRRASFSLTPKQLRFLTSLWKPTASGVKVSNSFLSSFGV